MAVIAAEQGDHDEADRLGRVSMALFRQLDHSWGIARSLVSLARAATARGDYASAQGLLDESVARQRSLGDRQGLSRSLLWLASLSARIGDRRSAIDAFAEALTLARDTGDRLSMARGLEGLAQVLVGSDPLQATRLLAAASAWRQTLGAAPRPDDYEQRAHVLDAAHGALNDTAFTGAWSAGAVLTPNQAVSEALDAAEVTASTPPPIIEPASPVPRT
jgi:tetratricopeptide (TPR) repeat protein